MNWSELRFWHRAIIVFACVSSAANLIFFLYHAGNLSWKLDPGLATLFGAIIGLGIVAWQANIGFKNLVRSQDNQSRLDREARLHQHQLESESEQRKTEREKEYLLSAIRAEIVALMQQAQNAQNAAHTMEIFYEHAMKTNIPITIRKVALPAFKAPVFQANIQKIGLLGISLAADVIKVISNPTGGEAAKIDLDTPVDAKTLQALYAAHKSSMMQWCDDLLHVAMRIRAIEENSEDPGTLAQMHMRKVEEAKKGKK